MEVPPLAPGIKESVDECTKKNEIQSQKRQYEITHMYYFVPNNSSHHPQKWIIRFHPLCIYSQPQKCSGHSEKKCTVSYAGRNTFGTFLGGNDGQKMVDK